MARITSYLLLEGLVPTYPVNILLPPGWTWGNADKYDLRIKFTIGSVYSVLRKPYFGVAREMHITITEDKLLEVMTNAECGIGYIDSVRLEAGRRMDRVPEYDTAGLVSGTQLTDVKLSALGANLKALRLSRGWTREEAVKRLAGGNYSSYKQMEEGTLGITERLLESVKTVYGVTTDELYAVPDALKQIHDILYTVPLKERVFIEDIIHRVALKPADARTPPVPEALKGWGQLLRK